MWRSVLFIFLFLFLGFIAGLISWVNWNWKIALDVFAIISCLGMILAVINLFTIKTISTGDIFLPIPIAVIWTVILLPFHISSMFFSAGAFIGSAFMLSISLWLMKENKMSKTWIIFPTFVYLYEMLPISIPGPFDDMFAFGGTAGSVFLQFLRAKFLNDSVVDKDESEKVSISEAKRLESSHPVQKEDQKIIDAEIVKD